MLITPLLPLLVHGQKPGPGPDRKLAFSQDFAKVKSLDPAIWLFDDGPVYNNEIEKYTKEPAHNAWIQKPDLVIEARKTDGQVTSARLESYKAWKHPYVEVVAEVPAGKGTWPAIWMLNDKIRQQGANNVGWPRCGEVDIMENVGFDPPGFHFSLHCQDYNFQKPKQRTTTVNVKNPGGFHKFAVDMQANTIVFYMDDKVAYSVKKTEDTFDAWPFDDSYYLILNLAIGGFWGGAKGVDDSIFPSEFKVRSVKIWE